MQTRGVVATGPGRWGLRRYPLPDVGAEDGILKIELAGVCGSDPGIYQGKTSRGPRPWLQVLDNRDGLPAVALGNLLIIQGFMGVNVFIHEGAEPTLEVFDFGRVIEVHQGLPFLSCVNAERAV